MQNLGVDVDGDGKADLVGFSSIGVYVAFSNGHSFNSPKRLLTGFGSNRGWNPNLHIRTLSDVNGDGKADIVAFGSVGVYVARSQGHTFETPKLWLRSFGYDGGWRLERHQRTLADLNGDGKQDIIGFGEVGVYVSFSEGTGFKEPRLETPPYDFNRGWRVGKHLRYLADFNGDKNADIVAFGNVGVYTTITFVNLVFDSLTNTLSEVFQFSIGGLESTSYGFNTGWRTNMHPRLMADVNGDGKADIVAFSTIGVYTSLSTGFDFTSPKLVLNTFGFDAGWRVNMHPRMMADVDGDGKDDIVAFSSIGVYVSKSLSQ